MSMPILSEHPWLPENAVVTEQHGGLIVAHRGGPVVFSAPHEAGHLRDGIPKRPEPGTGEMAFELASATGGSALCTLGEMNGDPNWDMDHEYRSILSSLAPSLVFDLHQMSPRGFDICLGTGQIQEMSASVWPDLARGFLGIPLTVTINYPFDAGARTITSAVQRDGISAVQIEMSSDLFYERRQYRSALVETIANVALRLRPPLPS